MTFRFACFVLFVYVCSADNDFLDGSGEGSGEEDVLITENLWQLTAMQQDDDDPDDAKERCGVDLLFVLDSSGSLEQIYVQHINWSMQITEALRNETDEVHIAMIQYADTPTVEFSLDTYRDSRDIINHMMTINFHSGGTWIGKALVAAKTELFDEDRGARKNASKIIVLFTDGLSVDDPIKHAEELRETEKVKIYVAYVGSDGFEQEMNRIAGGETNVFGSDEFSRLKDILLVEVKNAETCKTQDRWEIETADIKTTTNTTWDESSPRASTEIETSTIMGTISSTSMSTITSTATYDTSRKSLTKDTQLKHKSKKVPAKQATVPEDQDGKIIEEVEKDEFKSENTDATSFNAVNVEKQFIEAMTTSQQSTLNEKANKNKNSEDVVTVSKSAKVQKSDSRTKTTESPTNHSLNKGQGTSPLNDLPAKKLISAPRHTAAVHRISTARKSRKIGSAVNTEKNRAHCPQEILFIVDSSGSVQRIYDQQKEFLLSLLNELQIGEGDQRVALIQFAGSSHQRTEWTFDTYKNIKDIAEALSQVRHLTGTTYIGRALKNSIGVLETRRQGVPTTVILVSDGFSQDDASKPAEEIRRMPNVNFYAASMSHLNNFEYLTTLTGDPSKVYVGPRSEDFKQDLLRMIDCKRNQKL